jgi:glycosyltransferase involved in cell wall biosynthesis
MRILVIIPAHNEEANVGRVIHEIRGFLPTADLVVVDDGSRDDTARVAREAGAQVLSLPNNLGYGAAIQTGFRYATRNGYDIGIQMDSDGQHAPESVPALLEPVLRGEIDVALGSRFLGRADYPIPWPKKLGMKLFAAIASTALGTRITDPTTGFQALSSRVMRYFAVDNYPSDYPDADAIMVLGFRGFKIREVPVVMKARMAGTSMHTGYKTVLYVFKMFLSILVVVLRERLLKPPAAAPAESSAASGGA